MNLLKPQPPFVWPEPRARESQGTYEYTPPFGELALAANALFGTVSSLTVRGADVLEAWLEHEPDLKARLIVMVYPTCATRQADLSRLLQIAERASGRLRARICPLERLTDRSTNALCFVAKVSDTIHVVTGPSENFGLEPTQDEQVNFVFRADPAMVEAFRRHFDWLWAKSREINAPGATLIPDLSIPEGTAEGSRLWRDYMDGPAYAAAEVAEVDPNTGDVRLTSADGNDLPTTPTGELGVKRMDPLAERVARIYAMGELVSIDKLSRIPPLDAPLDPSLFGDASELQRGNVTRKVIMRVSTSGLCSNLRHRVRTRTGRSAAYVPSKQRRRRRNT